MRTVVDSVRGCGWRKPGGLYMISDGIGMLCDRLPIPLHVCPACGAGFRPARGWTWVEPDLLLEGYLGEHQSESHSKKCPLGKPGRLGERCGLLWIGEAFYKTPADWMAEGKQMGFSRRVNNIPRGFVPGETWILAAHRAAVPPTPEMIDEAAAAQDPDPQPAPGIFHIWRPDRVEYVVKGDETEEELDALRDRGIDPVIVVRDTEQLEVPA